MKILYIAVEPNMSNICSGITKKIFYQEEAFHNLGLEGKLIYSSDKNIMIEDLNRENIQQVGTIKGKYSNKNVSTVIYKYVLENYTNNELDYVYIRYCRSNAIFIDFLKKFRINNPKTKIYVEIVTYPYDREELFNVVKCCKTMKMRLGYIYKILQDRFYRKELKKYINNIVTFSDDDTIFGIKTIRTSNGVSSKIVGNNNSVIKGQDFKTINLIGVGGLEKHHGFDRVIMGIKKYLKNKSENNVNVIFHIVGDGNEFENLKNLVIANNLNDNVKLYGFKSGKELDDLYDNADIAIGSIGRHRDNIYQLADLKSREYCAKGLPFIKTVKDFDFENFKYCMDIPADESPVDINKVINFYKSITKNADYKNEMYQYAYDNLTWESKLKFILE